jgi:two-component sensor histidine kinase
MARPILRHIFRARRPWMAVDRSRLSTGMKMLLILSMALLPLGLMAVFASRQSAQTNRLQRDAEARVIADAAARQLDGAIDRATVALRSTIWTSLGTLATPQACLAAVSMTAAAQRPPIEIAIFSGNGYRLCATAGYSGLLARPPNEHTVSEVQVEGGRELLRVMVASADGDLFAVAEFSREALARLVRPQQAMDRYGLALVQGTQSLPLSIARRESPLNHLILVNTPVADGQLSIAMQMPSPPITAIEIIQILLPILMWLAGAMIGWLVVDRLLLRPLSQMQRAISAYDVGSGALRLPQLTTPAHEIRDLGRAFRRVTNALVRHETRLADGLARQTRLTREVHHRVKNNLQVVSSLINLHARGAESEEAANAYAAIQRRVDALAVVHRNHYAELEENRGVGLRALLGELAANLRGTAPPRAAHMTITIDVTPAFVTQDVAVPVAYLITEIVELIMLCDPSDTVAISLRPATTPGRATLRISAPNLASEACTSGMLYERFRRVVDGLARQLRSVLNYDPAEGAYAVDIAVVSQDGGHG